MYREDDITSDLNEQNMNCYFFFLFQLLAYFIYKNNTLPYTYISKNS